jgi:hypothetical protein
MKVLPKKKYGYLCVQCLRHGNHRLYRVYSSSNGGAVKGYIFCLGRGPVKRTIGNRVFGGTKVYSTYDEGREKFMNVVEKKKWSSDSIVYGRDLSDGIVRLNEGKDVLYKRCYKGDGTRYRRETRGRKRKSEGTN